jgi:hypothetical protein
MTLNHQLKTVCVEPKAARSGARAFPAPPRRRIGFFTPRRRRKNSARKTVFTPCTRPFSLLENFTITAGNAAFGDVILFSSACSSCDQFRNHHHRHGVFPDAADVLADAIGGVTAARHHHTQADGKFGSVGNHRKKIYFTFASAFFEEKRRREPTQTNSYLTQ